MPNHQQVEVEGNENSWEYVQLSGGPFMISRQGPYDLAMHRKQAEWSTNENAKYAAFIQKNLEKMNGKKAGNLWGLFGEMSKIVNTRNYRQCKLHHQKMTQEFGTINEIISFLTKSNSKFLSLMEKEIEKIEKFELSKKLGCQGSQSNENKHLGNTDAAYLNGNQQTLTKEKDQEEIKVAQIFSLKLKNFSLPFISA